MSAPQPPAPRSALAGPRALLFAAAFAAAGWVAVWQGFGLAGYGTDVHTQRVAMACLPLLVCGWVLFRPGVPRPVRALAALVGLGAAVAAWWYTPDWQYKSRMSLREAVEVRDAYRAGFAK